LPEDVDLEQIKELVKLVEEHHLAELTVEEHGVTITVKGAPAACAHTEQPVHVVAQPEPTSAFPPPAQPAPSNLLKIEAPMVGVFYRAPSPDSPPFVEVGDMIDVGQTVGLIEAMKVFSEIPSEVAGEVVETPAENEKLVQQGQTLVVVRPS
jgi:oxaloacetate decarboxylase alpha subunit